MELIDYEVKKNYDISFCRKRILAAYRLLNRGYKDSTILNIRMAIRAIKDYPDVVNLFLETLAESDCPELILCVADILFS